MAMFFFLREGNFASGKFGDGGVYHRDKSPCSVFWFWLARIVKGSLGDVERSL